MPPRVTKSLSVEISNATIGIPDAADLILYAPQGGIVPYVTDCKAATVASLFTGGQIGNINMTGYIQGPEIADPAAPAANTGRLYFRDSGGGKTQLVARFPTGAVQVVATEP